MSRACALCRHTFLSQEEEASKSLKRTSKPAPIPYGQEKEPEPKVQREKPATVATIVANSNAHVHAEQPMADRRSKRSAASSAASKKSVDTRVDLGGGRSNAKRAKLSESTGAPLVRSDVSDITFRFIFIYLFHM